MAETTTRTRRRRTTTATRTRRTRRSTSDSTPAASLLQSLNEVLAQNATLTRENERLKALLGRVSSLVGGVVEAATSGRGRRTRSTTSTATPAARATSGKATRRRKPLTDPVAIERRRAALAKAREVRAQRRAAAAGS